MNEYFYLVYLTIRRSDPAKLFEPAKLEKKKRKKKTLKKCNFDFLHARQEVGSEHFSVMIRAHDPTEAAIRKSKPGKYHN